MRLEKIVPYLVGSPLAVRCATICAPAGAHCSALTYFTSHITRIPHAQLLFYPNPLMFCCARLLFG
jgi:hypothetical protein